MKTGLMHIAMHRQLVEQAVNEERARCLEVVKEVYTRAEETNEQLAQDMKANGLHVWKDQYRERVRFARDLCGAITKRIEGAE